MLHPQEIRDYASRDWQRAADAKRERWKARRALAGANEGFRVGAALYLHARETRPDWPSAEARRADLAHHVELARLLHALSSRKTTR